jgi:hypothetical protein
MTFAPLTAEDVRAITLLYGGRLTPQEATRLYRAWVEDGFADLTRYLASPHIAQSEQPEALALRKPLSGRYRSGGCVQQAQKPVVHFGQVAGVVARRRGDVAVAEHA